MIAKRLLLVLSLAAFGACADKQDAPDLSGPSSFGRTVTVTATPDVLLRNGQSQSRIDVTVIDANGAPARDLTVFFGTQVTLGTVSAQSATTDATGKASVTFTAPDFGPDITTTLTVTPANNNHQNSEARTVAIRLVRPII